MCRGEWDSQPGKIMNVAMKQESKNRGGGCGVLQNPGTYAQMVRNRIGRLAGEPSDDMCIDQALYCGEVETRGTK